MNTLGHESVATTAGIPLLEEAFKKLGKNPRLGSFYFGNWLTDVSQLIDPVATDAAVEAAKKFVDNLLDEIKDTWFYKSADEYILLKEGVSLDKIMDDAKKNLHGALDFYLLKGNDTRQSELDTLVKICLRIKGYFKFAFPQTPGDDPPIDPGIFFKIFESRYTQYYPHEHLDRPEILPSKSPPEFATDQATGTRATNQPLNPDLYSYLRDDIEMTAGLLAKVDLDWASKAFEQMSIADDTDVTWNMNLAELGHAMHAVEDFFAHSNFIEHASLIMGQNFLPKKYEISANQVFLKRLKKFVRNPDNEKLQSEDDWTKLPPEDFIVTGYFDAKDTIISIAHLAEEIIGLDAKDPTLLISNLQDEIQDFLDHPDVPIYKAQTLLRNTLDFLEDPEQALQDNDNEVARKFQDLKDRIKSDARKVNGVMGTRKEMSLEISQRLFKEFSLFRDADPEIKNDIINYIILMSRVISVGKDVMTGYKAIKTIKKFIVSPIDWFTDLLGEKIKKLVKGSIIFYAKEKIYDYIGQDRIGCHSLIAKDHGDEWLYLHMKNCAIAVHWYIIKIMTRWSDPDWRKVALKSEDKKWVNWLELLEYFLRHPASESAWKFTDSQIPVTIAHTVVDNPTHSDSLVNLAIKYKKTALFANTEEKVYWEAIADANFDIEYLLKQSGIQDIKSLRNYRKKLINKILENSHLGYRVTPPNYAFKNGIVVNIPYQRLDMKLAIQDNTNEKWFMAVMEATQVIKKDGWKVFSGYVDIRNKQSVGGPPSQHHTLVYCKDSVELKTLIKNGEKLRSKSENAYRPKNQRT